MVKRTRRRSAAPTVSDITTPVMEFKAFLVAACWLSLSATSATAEKTISLLAQDNISEESRLYHKTPIGVYASSAPYAAYSFHVPAYRSAPKKTEIPVKEESVVIQNTHGYLKDSYGNKFVANPQTVAYKTTFPQQFVQLQSLPAHLSQPLVAAAPHFQYKQATPHFFGSTQFAPVAVNVGPAHLQAFSSAALNRLQQPLVYAENFRSLAPSAVIHAQLHGHPNAQQQQSTSNKAVYANNHTPRQFSHPTSEPKFQRLQEASHEHRPEKHSEYSSVSHPIPEYHSNNNEQKFQRLQESHHESDENSEHHKNPSNAQVNNKERSQIQAPAKEVTITTVANGQKVVAKLQTKPVLPLLDISLLEPLTFANPLVPQVQHFLPRINEATYHTLPQFNDNQAKKHHNEFIVKNTKSYDSGIIKGKSKPKNDTPKKKQSRPPQVEHNYHEEAPPTPAIIVEGSLNESPEFTYEINSPNYKETYKEQKVSYNKKTQSEPETYNYEMKTHKEPVHYSFVHSSKEPVRVQHVYYEGKGPGQKDEKIEEQSKEHDVPPQHTQSSYTPHRESESSEEFVEDERPRRPPQEINYEEHEQHSKGQDEPRTYLKPEHRQEEYHHAPKQEVHRKVPHQNSPQSHSYEKNVPILTVEQPNFQPIIPEYEEDIRILPPHKPHAPIKVDPTQHIPRDKNEFNPNVHRNVQNHSPAYHNDQPRSHVSTEQAQEITKQVESEEESPQYDDNVDLMEEMVAHSKQKEEDFENSYKNAAYGFPAFERTSEDIEKDIYNPETYGVSRYHNDYDFENSPFQKYQDEGDEYPKETRLNYKDSRDSNKERYFLDYAVSKPESLVDRFKHKEDYYKGFMKQRPEKYYAADDDSENNKKKSAKLTAAPSFSFHVSEQKPKQKFPTFAKYTAAPHAYEYDYTKEAPRDSFAHASRPHRFKGTTQFVEPQFQYGFEPISIPALLQGDPAVMASNHRLEAEKPGTRKKIFKEKFYIKKTSSSSGKPS